jgi:hypothetical protein
VPHQHSLLGPTIVTLVKHCASGARPPEQNGQIGSVLLLLPLVRAVSRTSWSVPKSITSTVNVKEVASQPAHGLRPDIVMLARGAKGNCRGSTQWRAHTCRRPAALSSCSSGTSIVTSNAYWCGVTGLQGCLQRGRASSMHPLLAVHNVLPRRMNCCWVASLQRCRRCIWKPVTDFLTLPTPDLASPAAEQCKPSIPLLNMPQIATRKPVTNHARKAASRSSYADTSSPEQRMNSTRHPGCPCQCTVEAPQ